MGKYIKTFIGNFVYIITPLWYVKIDMLLRKHVH